MFLFSLSKLVFTLILHPHIAPWGFMTLTHPHIAPSYCTELCSWCFMIWFTLYDFDSPSHCTLGLESGAGVRGHFPCGRVWSAQAERHQGDGALLWLVHRDRYVSWLIVCVFVCACVCVIVYAGRACVLLWTRVRMLLCLHVNVHMYLVPIFLSMWSFDHWHVYERT